MSRLQHEDITKNIIGCAFEVINELGSGFLESVYEKALLIALVDTGLSAQSQQAINVMFRNKNVGNFYADLLVENKTKNRKINYSSTRGADYQLP